MRPGVYVEEAPLPRTIEPPSAGLNAGAFIGTALRGPDTPTLVRSWSQFVALFGGFSGDDERTSLAPAVYQFFANGGPVCYVSRVLSGDAKKSYVDLPNSQGGTALTVEAASPGYWGNGLAVDIVHPYSPDVLTMGSRTAHGDFSTEFGKKFDRAEDWLTPLAKFGDTHYPTFTLVVRNTVRGVSVVVERFPDLSLDKDNPRYVERIVNDSTVGSQYIRVTDPSQGQSAAVVPMVVERVALAFGSDGTSVPSAADFAEASRDYDAIVGNLVFNVPGVPDVASIEAIVQERGDSFLVVDAPNVAGLQDLLVSSFPTSSYSAVYYPWIGISDPDPTSTRGAVRWVPPGGSVVGMILRTDASRGSFKSPAGAAATLSGAVGTSRRLNNQELDTLNSFHVNAIRPVPGSGIAVMGARTREFNTTAKYISVRRTLNYIKEQARQASSFALFEPNTPNLWEQLRVANGSFLSELWQVGGLAGRTFAEGFYVKVDSENNPPATIAAGEVHIEIGVAPVFPSEFVIIRIGQFESDASFTVTEE